MINQIRTVFDKGLSRSTILAATARRRFVAYMGGVLLALGAPHALALVISQTPLFLTTPVLPNVLTIYDNSESMDGTMSGQLIAGNDPATRGNIGRQVMRNTITNYRSSFNWGLMTYGMTSSSPSLYNTYGYFMGSDTGMVFTDDCAPVGGSPVSQLSPGVSASNGNRGCVPNPEPFTGGNYVTFDQSGDDPTINDVLYIGSGYGNQLWGLSPGTGSPPNTSYKAYLSHKTTSGSSWVSGAFASSLGTLNFTPTDAGFLPGNPPITRILWLNRAWGYYSNITGSGALNEAVQADSTTHYNNLQTMLGAETNSSSSGEVKNGAVFTPLNGALISAKTYFASSYGGHSSPISYSCQKNFAIMVTDGLPTGNTSGSLYSDADRAITSSGGGSYTLGAAYTDAINSITALRSTVHSSTTYDIKTYVVGLGDTLQNAGAVYVMNQMAAAGGTNVAYLASNQTAFQNAMDSITNDIVSQTGSAGAVAFNSTSLGTNTDLYLALFNSGDWSGDLLAYPLDPVSGAVSATSRWSAATQMDGRNLGSSPRTILTYNGSDGAAFQWSSLTTAQQTDLMTNPSGGLDSATVGSDRLDFIRGDRSNEGTGDNFRVRQSRLGDIVDSAPVYVGKPDLPWPDTAPFPVTSPYSAYKAAQAARSGMVYVGANDGMLHGFDSATGQEVLGYIPGNLYSSAVGGGMHFLTDPAYSHRYFVDLSPAVSDVYTKASPAGSPAWRTVLIGGERAGGRGLFALDVTDPSTFTESNAANVVLWEFSSANDPDLGSTFSNPTIALLNNGRWAAIFGNGYNDNPGGSGQAQLLILYLDGGLSGTWTLGTDYEKISTNVGTTSSRNGLSTPAVVDTNGDGVADRVYAGDLDGNMWAFDLSDTNAANWAVAYKQGSTPKPLFTTKSGQPITSQPVIVKHPTETDSGNLPNLLVMFGTGQYLDPADNSTSGTQSFYGVWDRGQKQLDYTDLVQQTFLTGFPSDVRVPTDNPVNYSASGTSQQYGWYMDLPASGERMVVDAKIRGDLVYFNTMIPSTAACSAGGSGWLMSVKYANGGPPSTAAFDYNNDGVVDSSDLLSNMAPGGQTFNMGLPTTPTFLGNKQYTAGTKTTGGTTIDQRQIEALKGAGTGRLSWDELQK